MSEERNPRMSSVLGETAIVVGNVDGTGDLEIRGRVQGSVTLSGRILVAETGVVLGSIEATSITIAGEVRGDLNASDGVEVQALGRVEGNIEAPRVGIEAGARVRGMLRTGGELPGTEAEKKRPSKKRSQKKTVAGKASDQAEAKPKPAGPPKAPRKKAGGRAKPAPVSNSSENPTSTPSTPAKKRSRKGPPHPPTFVKGARGRSR